VVQRRILLELAEKGLRRKRSSPAHNQQLQACELGPTSVHSPDSVIGAKGIFQKSIASSRFTQDLAPIPEIPGGPNLRKVSIEVERPCNPGISI
jgi:hypothetical protein